MESTLGVILSRQGVLRRKMDLIANNLANMNTTGFKGEKMMFVEHLERSKGGETVFGDKVAYVRDVASVRDTTEGPFKQTGNPLDLAIDGDGYFAVQTPMGERYTRAGNFTVDRDGQLVTQQGYPVLTDAGTPITFAPTDGEITITGEGIVNTRNGEIGRLRLVAFDDPYELRKISGQMFETEQVPVPTQEPRIAQGMLEQSNVIPIIEMTQMIEVSKSYQRTSRIIQQEDERIKKMIREYSQVS
ncbi:MAG: flagellar basal-body rod protein FlgF [Magnetovibrionaceae bacterium]